MSAVEGQGQYHLHKSALEVLQVTDRSDETQLSISSCNFNRVHNVQTTLICKTGKKKF